MTRDARLREPVRRALAYTINAQDPVGGGWRYKPGDKGDTSQLGWQLMAMKSGELAGFPIPEKTRQGIARYLQSVAAGEHGGLASYRPGEMTTRTMTAEAMVCRQFMGLPRQYPVGNEAGAVSVGRAARRRAFQSVLLVLCHAGHVSVARRGLATVEQLAADGGRGASGERRAAGRLLGHRRSLGRLRRPALHHGLGRVDARGLLPLPASVCGSGRARGGEKVIAKKKPSALASSTCDVLGHATGAEARYTPSEARILAKRPRGQTRRGKPRQCLRSNDPPVQESKNSQALRRWPRSHRIRRHRQVIDQSGLKVFLLLRSRRRRLRAPS